MKELNFKNLLLQTAFSCIACDGEIDKRELQLIKSLEEKYDLFGIKDIETELNKLVSKINEKGHGFLRDYLTYLNKLNLSESEEIRLVETTLSTIEADEKVEYSEIRFFKIIRSKLNVSNATLKKELASFKEIDDYLAQDIISDSYLKKLTSDYFDNQDIPEFLPIHIDEND